MKINDIMELCLSEEMKIIGHEMLIMMDYDDEAETRQAIIDDLIQLHQVI